MSAAGAGVTGADLSATGTSSAPDVAGAAPMALPSLAAAVLTHLAARGESLATAESVTGGLLAAALTSVPGSSAAYRGGVVAYATDLKERVLGVDAGVLDRRGPVDEEVAGQMAEGARDLLGATYAVATTGEAGPDSATGAPVGTVLVAVAGPGHGRVVRTHSDGARAEIRASAVRTGLEMLLDALEPSGSAGGPSPGGTPSDAPGRFQRPVRADGTLGG